MNLDGGGSQSNHDGRDAAIGEHLYLEESIMTEDQQIDESYKETATSLVRLF